MSDLLGAVRAWAREHARAGDLAEAEEVAVVVGRAVMQAVAEELVSQTAGKASYEKSSRPCECGRRAEFKGYRRRNLSTLAGEVVVERAYYHCRHCRRGCAPWDGKQGLNERLWTPGVKALVAELGAGQPYRSTTRLLGRVGGLRLRESSVEAIVAEVGGRVRASEREVMARTERGEAASFVGRAPERLYVSLDGVVAHVDGAWHEVKMAAAYAGVPGADGIDTSGPKQYVSAQEPAEVFGARAYVLASRCGVSEAQEVVVTGDGAEWIWNLADHHYPNATQILDYWHACQHIHDLAKSLYGEESVAGHRWARDHCGRLKEEGPEPLLRALRRRRTDDSEVAEALRVALGYFTKHRARMAYPSFRRRRMMIGSGPVEAGCKVVVGYRLKQAGMRWRHAGADAVIGLRCLVLNGAYDEIDRAARAA